MEQFSSEEKQLLAPFVTNTDRSVFVLTNLPEVIKGALFSRYSRSMLGLRELLLKEFICNQDSFFDEIQGGGDKLADPAAAILAVGKAQSFYDRILDGYGDDSIGELGGAHLALENVSILATKVLEDARIGGSPLEKSTRYVRFNELVHGDYQYYKDPDILKSAHSQLYLNTCRNLFATYSSLLEPLMEFVQSRLPREEGISQGAYMRSVRARVLDLIRGLLPASTLTNMGVFGNGRFFESLILRCRLQPFYELNFIGQQCYEELGKVIPSFIRRADQQHKHYLTNAQFQRSQSELLQQFAQGFGDPLAAQHRARVELVDHEHNADNKLLAMLLYPHSQHSLSSLMERVGSLSFEEKKRMILQLVELRDNRRHKPPRGLEMPYYTFDIIGDYGMYRDLQRHRVLTQERQPLSTRLGFEVPDELEQAGLAEPYCEAQHKAAEAFETIYRDLPQQAQYGVPLAYNIRWSVKINLRALMWLTELRSTPQGHESYRQVAQQMFLKVQEVHPLCALWLKFVDMNSYPLGRLDAEQRQENKTNQP